jgi:hypothetical protein
MFATEANVRPRVNYYRRFQCRKKSQTRIPISVPNESIALSSNLIYLLTGA